MGDVTVPDRCREIRERLRHVRDRIAQAAVRAGRRPEEIILVGVTKTIDPEDIRFALEAGLKDLGENRAQELCEKIACLGADTCSPPGSPGTDSPRWHMIGHLQSNKVRHLVPRVCLYHSADSESLMAELNRRAMAAGVQADCLLQVNMTGEASKSGMAPGDVDKIIATALKYPGIRVKGLMTIGPLEGGETAARAVFRRLRKIFIDIYDQKIDNIHMDYLSMGMSGDFEAAIEEGANMIRVGSAIFGPRTM